MRDKFDFSFLASILPPLVWRSRWNELAERYGLPYKKGYMQNLDAKKLGPPSVKVNGRVAYITDLLIIWLNDLVR